MDQRDFAEDLLRNAERQFDEAEGQLDERVKPGGSFIYRKWAAANTEYKILYTFIAAFLFICFVFIPAVVFGPSLLSSVSVAVGLTKAYSWKDVQLVGTGMSEKTVYSYLGWPSDSKKTKWAGGHSGKELRWKPRGNVGEVYVEFLDGKVITFSAQMTSEDGRTTSIQRSSRSP